MKVPCPSGLIFRARKWRIGDISELIDVKEDDGSSLPKLMVELAAEEVIEPGPYKFEDSKLDIQQLSLSDIAVANILIRVGTDPELLITPTCESCKKPQRSPKSIPLDEMPIYMASREGIEHLRTGVPIERQYPDGIMLQLKAVRGRDFKTLSKLQEQNPKYILEYQAVLHISKVNAPELSEPLMLVPHIREWYHKQSWRLRQEIEADIDELWGGADQIYKFRCDHAECRTTQEQQVPLDQTFYGLDDQVKQRRRQKRSSSMKSAGELMQTSSTPSSSEDQADSTSMSEG